MSDELGGVPGEEEGARVVLWIRGISRRACPGLDQVCSPISALSTPHEDRLIRGSQWLSQVSLSQPLECFFCLDEGKMEG